MQTRVSTETRLPQMELLARQLLIVAERTENAVIITDKHGRIEWVNEGFVRMTEYTLDEVRGRCPGDFLQGPATDPAVVNLMSDAIHDGRGFRVDVANYTKSGRKYWVAIEVQPIHDEQGNLANFVAVKSNVTAHHEIQETLRLARDRADAANRAKSEFLANMSHEIRTPMNGVLGMTELVLQTRLSPDQRRYIELAQSSARALMTVLNDVMDYSRMEAGQLDIQMSEFSPAALLADIVRAASAEAVEKGLTLTLIFSQDPPDTILSDATRLRQIVSNLLNNAIKFTEVGEVEVSVGCHVATDASCTLDIRIRDTGVGISPEKQDLVFEPFMQADTSSTRRFGGTGLGLSIATRLTRLLKGTIDMESRAGQGTIFVVQIPVEVVPSRLAQGQGQDQTHPALAGKKILLLDAHQNRASMMARWLKRDQSTVQICSSVEDATVTLHAAFLAGHAFDAVVIDTDVPDAHSLEVLDMMRVTAIPTLPLVLINADKASLSNKNTAKAYDAALLIKPVTREELCSALHNLVKIQSTSGSHIAQTASSETLKVLLVEDNAINQVVAETMLKKFGMHVDCAENGQEALLMIDKFSYDMIFMDLQMPVMSGLEALAVIRRKERSTKQHLSIIALTANAMDGDREHCLEAGMDGYLSKPITLEQLGAEISRVREKLA